MNRVSLPMSFPGFSPSSPCRENPGNEVVSTSGLDSTDKLAKT